MGNAFLQGEFASSASLTDLGHFSLTHRSGFNTMVLGSTHLHNYWPKAQHPDQRHCYVSALKTTCLCPSALYLPLPAEAPACFAVRKEGYGGDIIGDLFSSFIVSSSASMFWPWIWLFYSTRVSEHLVCHNALSRSEIKKVFTRTSLVKTEFFYCRGAGSIPGWGSKMPRAARCCQKINK